MREQQSKTAEPVKMSDAAKAAKREAHRKWQRENREKVKEYQARYWNKQAMLVEAALIDSN